MLGNTPVNYQTTSQAQSELNPEKGRYDNRLTDEMKQRLQRSQFTLGSSKNDFSTDYNLEYYDKSSLNNMGNANELKAIREKMRGDNYEAGNDKTNYISENAGKYTKPAINLDEIKQTKLQTEENTKNLRSQHFNFGSENVPWKSSNREQYTPKKIDNNRYNSEFNDLIRNGNFTKSKEDRDFKSEAIDSYNKKPLTNNRVSNEFRDNLRRNHFDFGDKNSNVDMNTVNREDYKDPRLDKNHSYGAYVLDPNKLRRSQWNINGGGDGNYFNTTYSRTMTPKKGIPTDLSNNENLKNHIQIGDNKMNKEDYRSIYESNFGNKNLMDGNYYVNSNDKQLADNIKNFNKNSHLEIGKGQGEFNTTMNDYYKYNPNDASQAYNQLNDKVRAKIRSSHFEIGSNNEMEKETSNRRDYIAYPPHRPERIDSARRNYESMVMGKNNIAFDGKTIYMTDYIKKPFPREDEGLDLYLFNKYTKANE